MTPQQNQIIEVLKDREWHCGTVFLPMYLKDDRKRISEINDVPGYKIVSQACDGRCGHKHHSGIVMRRLVSTPEPIPSYERKINYEECSCYHFSHFGYCYDNVEERKLDQLTAF